MKYKLNKPAKGKNKRKVVETTLFGGWNEPRIRRIRGMKFRWFPYSEMEKEHREFMDHMTVHVDDDGNGVVESQPYQTKERAWKELSRFCQEHAIEMSFGESDWAPGSAISIEFRDVVR